MGSYSQDGMAGIEGDCGSLGPQLFLQATGPLGLACYLGFLLLSQGLGLPCLSTAAKLPDFISVYWLVMLQAWQGLGPSVPPP